MKHFGKILSIHQTYCFVKSEMDGLSYFLHWKNIWQDWPHIEVGQFVEFSGGRNIKGLAAVNAVVIGER